MNSAEEITKYSDDNSHYRSPNLARKAGDADESFTEKSPKKDKKWSLGGLFRRKKKEVESESSSEDDNPPKRGFLQRRRQKKEDKKRRRNNKPVGTFDHVVGAPVLYGPNTNGVRTLTRDDETGGILSEPTSYMGVRNVPKPLSGSMGSSDIISKGSRDSLNKNRPEINTSRGSLQSSLDSVGVKSRREKVKARVEALRDRLKNDSSSDEGSQKSNASSITRFKSDESLVKNANGSLSRKSRTARTERYIKRLTKEEEIVLNKEAELEKQRLNNNENNQNRMQNRWIVVDDVQVNTTAKPQVKPNSNYSPIAPQSQKLTGLSTIPPSHNIIHRAHSNLSDQRNYYNQSHYPNGAKRQNEINMQNNYKNCYIYNNPRNDYLPDQRSFSYDCNINRSPTPKEEEILHVQFPIGKPIPKPRNPNLINHYSASNQSLQRTPPPPPPPRDPRRMYSNFQYDSNNRPMSYAFENGNQRRSPAQPIIDRSSSVRTNNNIYPQTQSVNRSSSFGWQPNYRSNSEDHIAQVNQYMNIQRPASATPDMPQQRFIRRHPKMEQYQYFADKTPRSRKPIHISTPTQPDQTYLSDSQMLARAAMSKHPINAASQFWKQKDMEESKRKSQMLDQTKEKIQKPEHEIKNKSFSIISIPVKPEQSSSSSDLSPLYPKQVFEQNIETVKPLSKAPEKTVEKPQGVKKEPPLPPTRGSSRNSSGSSVDSNWNPEDETERKRRSSNLEDALDELEAIYKSLRLGDEDLLDRAERRDVSVAAQKLMQSKEPLPKWSTSSGTQSDTGYNYGFDTVDCPRVKREIKRVPNIINDDMAYRRLYNDKPIPLDPQVPPVSYLLTSPLLGDLSDEHSDNVFKTNEPDITLDDVVYRNLKRANNSVKVVEPQPLFGIPLGPITAAANSDYLHAVPENRSRPRFVPQKSPDIVKDDLAYRSLRKDNSKDPTLPPLGPEDYINNNSPKEDNSVKKKRAVRSMSANVFNLMHRENENEFDKAQSLTDIADAMEIAHKILKEHNSKIFSKMAVSDSESKSVKPNFSFNFTPTSTETLTESKTNLLNENDTTQQKIRVYVPLSENEVINQKPPLCPTPDKKSSKPPTKESTPNRVSPMLEENVLDKSHLEELLTALAIEARETSEKLGNDLRLLDEEHSRKCTPRMSGSNTPNKELDTKTFKSTNEKLMDIDAVSEHAKLCEKLLECVVESTELIAPKIPEVTENKDTEILTEEVNELPNEPSIYKSVANIIVTRKADIPQPVDPRPEMYSESDHDYDNINDKIKIRTPDEEVLEKIMSDDEFKDELSEDKTKPVPSIENEQDSTCKEGEVCRHVECFASNPQECACYNKQNLTIILNPPADFDNVLTNYNTFGNEYEHSSGFHTESGSSSPDSLLENANAINDFQIMFNNEICTNINDEAVFESSKIELNSNSEYSSISSTGSNNISEYKDVLTFSNSDINYTRSFLDYECKFYDSTEKVRYLVTALELEKNQESSAECNDSDVDKNSLNLSSESLQLNDKLNMPSTSFYISDSSLNSSSEDDDSDNINAPSTSQERTISVDRTDRSGTPSDKSIVAWYQNPTTLALACSYGIACAHQIALLDVVTILGLFLAILSVIAAFVL